MQARATLSPSTALPASAWAAVAFSVGYGIVLFLFFAGSSEAPPVLGYSLLAGAAMFCVSAAPGVLALLARRGRPHLLRAGAGLAFGLSLTLLCVIPVPLAAGALLLAASRHMPLPPGQWARAGVVALSAAILGFAAVNVLFARQDEVCWTYTEDRHGHRDYEVVPRGSPPPNLATLRLRADVVRSDASCADVVAPAAGFTSLALTGFLVASTSYLARPVGGSPAATAVPRPSVWRTCRSRLCPGSGSRS